MRSPRAPLNLRPAEPLRGLPAGTVLTPLPPHPLILHMDGHRRRTNQITDAREPLVRIVRSPGEVYHVRAVELGPCTLAEDYTGPLPDRPEAVCVLTTLAPILILE